MHPPTAFPSLRARAWLGALVALASAAPLAPSAWASLGGSNSTALRDGAWKSQARVAAGAGGAWVTDTVVLTPGQALVHEYSGASGRIFAVSWSGPMVPDLRRLYAGYFPAYEAWRQTHPSLSLDAPVEVRSSSIVAYLGGHMRAFAGSAYVPALVPGGVDLARLNVTP
jgi:hypothetical protein